MQVAIIPAPQSAKTKLQVGDVIVINRISASMSYFRGDIQLHDVQDDPREGAFVYHPLKVGEAVDLAKRVSQTHHLPFESIYEDGMVSRFRLAEPPKKA